MAITRKRRFGTTHLLCMASLTLGVGSLTGCSTDPTDEPAEEAVAVDDHGDHGHESEDSHPKTYAEAVEAVVGINDTIKTAFAADDEDTAHGPLHKVGHVLEDLGALAEKAEMTDEQRTSVKDAVEKLFEAFGAVDDTMHGNEGKSYDEVASQISENLKVLKDACENETAEE
ncbi:MAG: hypothetical protein AB8G99_25665 [Planctomycetaceae bacterium]